MSRIGNIPRRFLFLVLAVLTIIPILYPFPVPVPITDHTRNFYDVVDNLEAGSVVFLGASVGSRDLEAYPQHVATLKQLKEKNVKLLLYHFYADAAMGSEWVLSDAGYDPSTYGEDHVNLGFMPGEDATLSAWADDIIATKPVDHYGDSLIDMPIFDGISNIQDIDLIIVAGGGTPGPDDYARSLIIPFDK